MPNPNEMSNALVIAQATGIANELILMRLAIQVLKDVPDGPSVAREMANAITDRLERGDPESSPGPRTLASGMVLSFFSALEKNLLRGA